MPRVECVILTLLREWASAQLARANVAELTPLLVHELERLSGERKAVRHQLVRGGLDRDTVGGGEVIYPRVPDDEPLARLALLPQIPRLKKLDLVGVRSGAFGGRDLPPFSDQAHRLLTTGRHLPI